jgi:membrane protein implicated in regulation of membrane protease activity
MNPRAAGVLALIMASVGIVVWFAMPDDVWILRAILVFTIALVAGTFFDRARFPGASRTESTMGPDGDVLIGFQARVISVTPLKVEARGSVWSARLTGVPAVSAQARVEIVGREGLTLLVRASEEAGAQVKTGAQ